MCVRWWRVAGSPCCPLSAACEEANACVRRAHDLFAEYIEGRVFGEALRTENTGWDHVSYLVSPNGSLSTSPKKGCEEWKAGEGLVLGQT